MPKPDAEEERSERPTPPAGAEPSTAAGRFPWASLLWRVFLTDALACPACTGRMRILVVVTSRSGVMRFLDHVGLPTDPPRFHPPRPPPQQPLPFDGDAAFVDPVPGFERDPSSGTDFEN